VNVSKLSALVFLFIFATAADSFSFQVFFRPRISSDAQYTDNVFLTEDDKEDDTIVSVTPGFTVGLLGKKAGLDASYDPSWVTYLDGSRDDTWRHFARGGLWWQASKHTRLELSDDFLYTEDPNSDRIEVVPTDPDPLLPADTTERRGRNKYWRNAARSRMTHQFGEKDSWRTAFTHRILRNDDDEFFEDSDGYIPEAGLTYWFAEQWALDLDGRYTHGNYDQPSQFFFEPNDDFDDYYGSGRIIHSFGRQLDGYVRYAHTYRDFDGDSDDYQIFNPAVGFDYDVGPGTRLEVETGYFYRDRDNGGGDSGFNGSADLTHEFSERGTLFLSVSGGYESADFTSEALGFNQYAQASGRVEYRFNRFVGSDVFGSYRHTKYKDSDPERTDKLARAGAGLTFNPLRWMAIRAQYALNKLDSDESSDYTENRFMLGVTLSTDQPWRW
jgi:hypothetical protein